LQESDLGLRPATDGVLKQRKNYEAPAWSICSGIRTAGIRRKRCSLSDRKGSCVRVEKLDVATLPSAIRPKLVKSKKTTGDYGYVAREVDEKK